ncbi:MAG TPA: DUF3618 domain-containing protein [Chloroflexia bacterium]|nr:DUF3618 domain-containing protein [Chloroflexia bacterium]
MGERADEINSYQEAQRNPQEPDTSSVINGYVDSQDSRGNTGYSSDTRLDLDRAYQNRTAGDVDTTASAGSATDSDDISAIEGEIEQTRAEMSQTIDEIQARLAPERLVDEAKEAAKDKATEAIDTVKQTVHDATIGRVENMVDNVTGTAQEAGSGIMETIKQNPIPAAMVGIGLGWLLMNRQGNSQSQQYNTNRSSLTTTPYTYGGSAAYGDNYSSSRYNSTYSGGSPYSGYQSGYSTSDSSSNQGSGIMDTIKQNPIPATMIGLGAGYLLMNRSNQSKQSSTGYNYGGYSGNSSQSTLDQVRSKASDVTSNVGDKVGQVGQQLGDTANSATEKVGDIASTTAHKVGDVAGEVGDTVSNTVGNVASGVQHGAQNLANQPQQMIQDNPLMIGAIALAAGVLVGMMLPSTKIENQLLGETRENVMDKVQDIASQTKDKVENVAEKVQQTTKEEAKNQGLVQ